MNVTKSSMTAALIDSLFLQKKKKVIHLLFKTLRFHGASAAFPGRFRGTASRRAVTSPLPLPHKRRSFLNRHRGGGLSVVVAVSWGGQRPSPAQPLRDLFLEKSRPNATGAASHEEPCTILRAAGGKQRCAHARTTTAIMETCEAMIRTALALISTLCDLLCHDRSR